jgi:PRC-barrel domain protein
VTDDEGPQIGYLALPRGVPVVTSDGVRLGRVHRVLDNAREHIFDGIVVDTGSRKVFVDAPEVARIAERRVTLTIGSADTPSLPEHRGRLGAMEASAKRSAARWRRRLGGR